MKILGSSLLVSNPFSFFLSGNLFLFFLQAVFAFVGFIRKSLENKFILAIDWTKVEAHMAAVKANPFRIKLGKCIPLTTHMQVSWS
jgi:hypothetical protein